MTDAVLAPPPSQASRGAPVISLRGVSKNFGAVSALTDIELDVHAGEVALVGVAQTAEVLNLVERVRDRGLGVIVISHNMDDVRAVADRIVVLRLGRNNGVFTPEDTRHDLIAAITGAAENSVSRRAATKAHTGEGSPA
jgi:D-xylose transport system ATP-binding protein